MTASRQLPWLLLCLSALSLPAQAASGPLLSALTLGVVPLINVARPLADALPERGASLNFADRATLQLSSRDQGRWELRAGQAIWRLALHSDEARNLSLTLSDLQLDPAAELRLYDGQGSLWHGPIDGEALTQQDRYWTPLVIGDTLLLELRVPLTAQADSHLAISALHYGYRDLDNRAKSGSCNVDVACPEADPWTDAVRAAARITVGGRRLCSAVLLNNTRQDGDPLLLTANHCGVGESDDFPASSVVVYWNYETSRCAGNPDGSLSQNQSGSTLLARGEAADFSLVRLNRQPPANFRAYYAGWDATGANPSSGASVHHPSGNEKRISFYTRQASKRTVNVDGSPVQSWEVFWSRGVTEPGSSGSGLWNAQQRVIGQLSGGSSSCESQQASDVYGRLDVAWQAGNLPSERLRPWLDPIGSGAQLLDGLDPSDGNLLASNDLFGDLPTDQTQLALEVLSNDRGVGPLRLSDASADQGQVRIVDNRLQYDWPDTATDADRIRYQVTDRNGETQQAEVLLERRIEVVPAGRGGALLWPGLLLLLLCRWPRSR